MTRVLRLSRLSPLLLLAAALVALAVFFVNQAPRAQAQSSDGSTREIWSSTITVGGTVAGIRGFWDGAIGSLQHTSFTYSGQSYVVKTIMTQPGGSPLLFTLDKTIPNNLKSALTLYVGDRQFALAEGTRNSLAGTNNQISWNNPGLSLTAGQTVQVRLTEPVQTLTASFSPDEPVKEDWETNSAHDLWSPTLTVQDLSTTAPAKVGCDDSNSNSSARCRSALTRRDFTFDGVRYWVEAISYITTYPERLTLKLDKAIPQNLQSCLTLYAGNARIRLADDGIAGAGVDVALTDSDSTLTLTEISGAGFGLNWSAGDTVNLRLPNVGCLTLTLSKPVTEETSLQWRRGGTADSSDYQRISLPTFAAGTTTASTPVKPIDDSEEEGCETIILAMTMWPGTDRAVHEKFTFAIQDNDGGNACVGGG